MWKLKLFAAAIALFSLVVSLSGCGKQEFEKVPQTFSETALGSRILPAKVDIVIVPDNSASMTSAFNKIESKLGGFVSDIRAQGWNYHIMRSPIVNPGPINKALINPDFNGTTLPDGTPNPNTDIVPTTYALTDVNQFLPLVGSINGSQGSQDQTYSNTLTNIENAMANTSSNLFRSDALLAIIVITNGADYSVDPLHNGNVSTSMLAYWANEYQNLKSNSLLLKFYPVAANSAYASPNCMGGGAYIGSSYTRMLDYLSGLSANFCSDSALSQVLSNIQNDLSAVRQRFVFTRLVLPVKPIPSSIHVFKNGGELEKSALNGFTYDETQVNPSTVFTVTGIEDENGNIIPYEAERRTGFVIELHGDAILRGDDTYRVAFEKP